MNIFETFKLINYLKEKEGLKIYDTHVHPFDVMGVMKVDEYKQVNQERLIYGNDCSSRSASVGSKQNLVDKLRYNSVVNALLRGFFLAAPSFVEREIRKSFLETGSFRLLDEMRSAQVDYAAVVPIAPWVSTSQLSLFYTNSKFILLGSVDIHNTKLEEIHVEISNQVKKYKIRGLKLHPNLQGFLPQPSHNPPELKEKLEIVYQSAAQHRLYLLFHGGYTNFLKTHNLPPNIKKYRKPNNALLVNFINEDGTSEVLGNYGIPVVIAHLGNYSRMIKDFSHLRLIVKHYNNVYFDTAGTNPNIIKWFLQSYGSRRLLFGSDAYYHQMGHSLELCGWAICNAVDKKTSPAFFSNILGRNFQEKVLGFGGI